MLVLYQCHMFFLSYYIILRHFIGLTYWKYAQCHFSVFVLFLLQKVTSGNILGFGRKFMTIFYSRNEEGRQKGDPGRDPQPWGGSHPWVTGGPRPRPVHAPRAPPRVPLTPIKSPPTQKNSNTRRIFPNTQQSSAAIADKFRGFRTSYSGTLPGRGSTARAISINTAASRDEEGVVPHRGWGLYK